MRIFFYANTNISDSGNGVTKKVISQVKSLKQMGHEVWLSSYTEDGVKIFDNEEKVVYEKHSWLKKGLFRTFKRFVLLQSTRKFFTHYDMQFDICYVRFHFFDLYFYQLLKKMKQKSYIIVEAHWYPYRSFNIWSKRFWLVQVSDILFEPISRKYIDMVAVIGNYNSVWNRKTVIIDNAVDLEEISLQEKIKNENSLRLISVSIERRAHGYDKVIRGLWKYYQEGGQFNIRIYLVGEYLASTKKLITKLNLNRHIIFTGKLSGKELDKIYNLADIGLGMFNAGRYRKYGSSIKAKEYFAKGIPFINGWKEHMVTENFPYVKQIDSSGKMIDFGEIIDFYSKIKDDDKMPMEMRRYAENNYIWEKHFNKIFESIGSL